MSAILTSTLDALIDAARDCREVAIIGASTPLLAEAFQRTPVTLLSGVVADDPEVLQVVSEGGGMREFKKHVRKVSLALPR